MIPRSAGNTDDAASESPSNSVTHSTVDATAVTCDQAIFTSVRTPMGEGYRIIAASRGVTAAEKQAITKTSPSHDSLIGTGPDATGLASYLLPTGRLCIAKFWCAGAEQSGRGGKRVYTHNIVMTSEDLSRFAFSVFAVIRSAEDSGVFTGALEPEKVLPQLSLPSDPVVAATFADSAELSRCASHVVEKLLDNRKIVLQVSGDPLAAARCLLAALPGPMRCEISFAAGLRFALSRSLRLNVTCRDHGVTMRRVQGQPIDLIASDDAATPTPDSAWARLVQHHFDSGDIASLNRWTSKPFASVDAGARERIANLCLALHDIASNATPRLLLQAKDGLARPPGGSEGEIAEEFLERAVNELTDRLAETKLDEIRRCWPVILDIRRQGESGRAFARPLIDAALQGCAGHDPVVAAELALDLARSSDPRDDKAVEIAIARLLGWCGRARGPLDPDVRRVCYEWIRLRPTCPVTARLRDRVAAESVPTP